MAAGARRLSGLALLVAVLAACGGSTGAPHASTASASGPAASATVWLCRPGAAGDPCEASLDSTVVSPRGTLTVERTKPARRSRFDCFYVYPTVSPETTANADLRVGAAERFVATAQASRFSTVCRVWAPIYRQQTLTSLLSGGVGASAKPLAVAYASLLAAWRDYLAHENRGRPVIFVGHSQGAAMLIRLLASEVDRNAALRRRLVSAIILGGNVTIPSAGTTAGSFRHIPPCSSNAAFGCVIAYSSFPGEPPAGSLFGRPGQGISLQSGQRARRGVAVLCVNPAGLGPGAGTLEPYFPATSEAKGGRAISTAWVTFPALYRARCRHAGNATWLSIADIGSRADSRPRVSETAGPLWGFHTYDVNLALGNLVADVAGEESAYARVHP